MYSVIRFFSAIDPDTYACKARKKLTIRNEFGSEYKSNFNQFAMAIDFKPAEENIVFWLKSCFMASKLSLRDVGAKNRRKANRCEYLDVDD